MSSRKVLVVDRDGDLLLTLQCVLESAGVGVVTTRNFERAAALMLTGHFDFLILSDRPPRRDAHALVSKLQRRGIEFAWHIVGSIVTREEGFSGLIDLVKKYRAYAGLQSSLSATCSQGGDAKCFQSVPIRDARNSSAT